MIRSSLRLLARQCVALPESRHCVATLRSYNAPHAPTLCCAVPRSLTTFSSAHEDEDEEDDDKDEDEDEEEEEEAVQDPLVPLGSR